MKEVLLCLALWVILTVLAFGAFVSIGLIAFAINGLYLALWEASVPIKVLFAVFFLVATGAVTINTVATHP